MKRAAVFLAAAGTALAFLAAAQAPKRPDIVGTWAGTAVAPGMRFEMTAVFDRGESGYTGKLSDAAGLIADAPLREIVFKDGTLTFELDLYLGPDPMLIRIELVLDNDTLRGYWFDLEGNSDAVELVRKR